MRLPNRHNSTLSSFHRFRTCPSRRGSTITTALMALSITGLLAATAWVAGPAYLLAQPPAHEAIAARSERNQEIIELLGNLINSSALVAAIHPREPNPYAEVVLRIAGDGEMVEPGEVALLSHSRLLQTVTLYTHDDPHGAFDRTDLFDRGFPDRWRDDPDVRPILLAAGLSDMQVQLVEPNLLRIALTWDADSADGEDEATLYVKVRTGSE